MRQTSKNQARQFSRMSDAILESQFWGCGFLDWVEEWFNRQNLAAIAYQLAFLREGDQWEQ